MEAGFKEEKQKQKQKLQDLLSLIPRKSYSVTSARMYWSKQVMKAAQNSGEGEKVHLPMGGASKSHSKEQEGPEGFFWSSLGMIYHSEFYVHLFSPIDYLPKVKSLFVLILRFSQCLA